VDLVDGMDLTDLMDDVDRMDSKHPMLSDSASCSLYFLLHSSFRPLNSGFSPGSGLLFEMVLSRFFLETDNEQ